MAISAWTSLITISSSTVTAGETRTGALTELEAGLALLDAGTFGGLLFDLLLEELADGDVLPGAVVCEAERNLVALTAGGTHDENAAG